MGKELTAVGVKRLAEPRMHSVGGVKGLYLNINKGGSRSWILKTMVGKQRREMGLGGYPDVSLSMAREKAREYREKIRQGVDPAKERLALREALIESQKKQLTFEEACHLKFEQIKPKFRNKHHTTDWIGSLKKHALPKIGGKDINTLTKHDIKEVLELIWTEKHETATRVRQRIESVFDWAISNDHFHGDNPAIYKGNLKDLLAHVSEEDKERRNHPALSYKNIHPFLESLKGKSGNSIRALEFAILCASRSKEVREMTWDEIDVDSGLWVIPKRRMKAGKEHTVPLTGKALEILKSQPHIEGSPYVFPAPRGGALSDMALLEAVRRMPKKLTVSTTGEPCVVHGFRSTFKDWARTQTSYQDEASELQLAHVSTDATRAAYARDALVEIRHKMMKDYSDYCYGI